MVKTVHALVQRDSTTLQLMQKLHDKKGIPIHEMEVWYSNTQLEEDKPLSDYNILNGTYLTLKTFKRTRDCPCVECKRLQQKITVTVSSLSGSFQVECALGEPVETLKRAIWKHNHVAIAKQKLDFNGQTLQDHRLLATYMSGDDDEESGAPRPAPEVTLLVDQGTPSVMDRIRSMVSFRTTPTPEPAAPSAA